MGHHRLLQCPLLWPKAVDITYMYVCVCVSSAHDINYDKQSLIFTFLFPDL